MQLLNSAGRKQGRGNHSSNVPMQHTQQPDLCMPVERQTTTFIQLDAHRQAGGAPHGTQSRGQPGNSESKGRGQAEINLNQLMSTSLANP